MLNFTYGETVYNYKFPGNEQSDWTTVMCRGAMLESGGEGFWGIKNNNTLFFIYNATEYIKIKSYIYCVHIAHQPLCGSSLAFSH